MHAAATRARANEPRLRLEPSEGNSAARRSAWPAVGTVALGTFVMVTTEFLPIGLLTSIARDLHVSEGTAGLTVTVPGIVAAIAAPASTIAAKNTDRRLLLIALATLILLSNVLVALSTTFVSVLAGRVLLGLSVGGFWTFAAAVGRRLVPEADGGRATALILTGISVGTVVGVPIATAIGAHAGWRSAFGGVAALALLAVVGQSYLLPSLPSRRAVSLRDMGALLLVPRAVIGFAASALIAGGHFAAYTYLEPFLTQVAGFTPAALSWALAAYGLAGVLGTFIGERASDKDVRKALLFVDVVLAAAILFAIAFGSNVFAVTASVVLWGAAFGAVPVCVQIWTYQAAPEQFETGSALMVSVFQVALAFGAFAGGELVDRFGLRSAFGLGVALAGSSALLVYLAHDSPAPWRIDGEIRGRARYPAGPNPLRHEVNHEAPRACPRR
jgi:predicted MFS family arabinose efflux permease